MSKSYDRLAEMKAIVLEAFKGGKETDVHRIATMIENKDIPVDTPIDADGRTCLMLAADMGHLGLVKYLVEKLNASLNLKDNKGNTALQYAADKSGEFRKGGYTETTGYGSHIGSRKIPDSVRPVQKYVDVFEFLFVHGARHDKECKHIPSHIQNLIISSGYDRDKHAYIEADTQHVILEEFKKKNQIEAALKWFQQLKTASLETQEWYIDTLINRGELNKAIDYFDLKVTKTRESLHEYHCKFAAAAKTGQQLKKSLIELRSIDDDYLQIKSVFLFSEVETKESPASNPFALRFLRQLSHTKSWQEASKNILKHYCDYGSYETRQIASYFSGEEKKSARDEDYLFGLQTLYTLAEHVKPDAQYAKKIFQGIIEKKPTAQKLTYAKLRLAASCCIIAESSTEVQQKELDEAVTIYEEIINKPEFYSQLDFFARAEIAAQLQTLLAIHPTTKLRGCILKQFSAEKQLKDPCRDLLSSFDFSMKLTNEEDVVQWRDILLRGIDPNYLHLTTQQRNKVFETITKCDAVTKHHREIFFDLYQLELKLNTDFNLMVNTFNLIMEQKILADMKCWDHTLSLISDCIHSKQPKGLIELLIRQIEQMQTLIADDQARSARIKSVLFVAFQKIDSPKAFDYVPEEKEVKTADLCALHIRIARQSDSKTALTHYRTAANLGDENAAFEAAKLLRKEHKDKPYESYPAYQLAVELALKNKNEKVIHEAMHEVFAIQREFLSEPKNHVAYTGSESILIIVISSGQVSPEKIFELLHSIYDTGVYFSVPTLQLIQEKLGKTHGYNADFRNLCSKLKIYLDFNFPHYNVYIENTRKLSRINDATYWLVGRSFSIHSTVYKHIIEKYIQLETNLMKAMLGYNPKDLKDRMNSLIDRIPQDEAYWIPTLKNILPPIINALKASNQLNVLVVLLSIYDRLIKLEKSEQITGKTLVQLYAERAEVEIQLVAHPDILKTKSKGEELFKRNLILLKNPNPDIRKIARQTLNDLCRIATRDGRLELAARANYLPALVKLAQRLNGTKKETDPDFQSKMDYLSAACLLLSKNYDAICHHFGLAQAELDAIIELANKELKKCCNERYNKTLATPQDLSHILNPAATLFDRVSLPKALGIKSDELDAWQELWNYDSSAVTSVAESKEEGPKPEAEKPIKLEFLFLETLPAQECKEEAQDELSTDATPAYTEQAPCAPVLPVEGAPLPISAPASTPMTPSAPAADVDEGKEQSAPQSLEGQTSTQTELKSEVKKEEQAEVKQATIPAPSFTMSALNTMKLKDVPSDALSYTVFRTSSPKHSDKNEQNEGEYNPVSEVDVVQEQEGLETQDTFSLEPGEAEIISADLQKEGAADHKKEEDLQIQPQQLPIPAVPERKRPLPISGSAAELPAPQISVAERPISVSFQTPEGKVSIDITSGNPMYVEAILTSLVQTIARFPQQTQSAAAPVSHGGMFGNSVAMAQLSSSEKDDMRMNLAG